MSPNAEPYDSRPIDSPVQPCTSCHWFSIELTPAADKKARLAWWPARRHKSYPAEPMKITLAGVGAQQTLDANGKFDATGIPAGDATVKFDTFYDKIDKALAKDRRF